MNGRSFTTRRHPSPSATKSGVALLLVLGLIAILSLILLTFSRVTRTERLSSWHEVNSLRAEELARLALTHAMADVRVPDIAPLAFASTNEGELIPATELATRVKKALGTDIPYAIYSDAQVAAPYWIPILIESNFWPNSTNFANSLLPITPITNGRIAYVVLNVSGFADINAIGVTNWALNPARIASTNVNELDLTYCYDIWIPSAFASNRVEHRRYETMDEAFRLNGSALTPTNFTSTNYALVPFSYEPPGREVYIARTNDFGTRAFTTNQSPRFCVNDLAATNWSTRITNIMAECGMTNNADELACRLADYLDTDRIPTNSQFISEAIPLLNEVGLREDIYTNALGQLATQHVFEVELWYPFHPPPSNTESFSLTLETVTPAATIKFDIQSADCSVTNFPCFTWTNTALTNLIAPVVFNVSISNAAVFTNLYTNSIPFTNTCTNAWNDPRIPTNYDKPATSSLGSMNTNCTALIPGSGLPIYHRDGPMRNIGEIGYIHTGRPWESIDLADPSQASLLDRLTVRSTNYQPSTRGLISAITEDTNTLDLLFSGTPLGITNTSFSTSAVLTDASSWTNAITAYRYAATNSITLGGLSSNFLSRFDFGDWTNSFPVGSDLREDLVRGFVELVSFRHSLYYVIVSAQALAGDGQTPVAERNAIALVWRDTYTGQYFVRWFRWIE